MYQSDLRNVDDDDDVVETQRRNISASNGGLNISILLCKSLALPI